ncbi:MAG TPA: sulfur carrier protein ThiS [Vicinamibacteria bacterium]|nr:sulfur carrier protein ThiS [Vicinamibacteria bacterium]
MEIVLNGEARRVPEGSSVTDLLRLLGLGDRSRLAVERNRQVVPRAQQAATALLPGDRVEIVTFVGGGRG